MAAPKTPLLDKGFERTREELREDLDHLVNWLRQTAERYTGTASEALGQRELLREAADLLGRAMFNYHQRGWMTADELNNYRKLIQQVLQR